MGSGLFALLLRELTWWQAATLACVAIAFNAAVLPSIGGRRLYRPVRPRARLSARDPHLSRCRCCCSILAFPARLDIVAAAWGDPRVRRRRRDARRPALGSSAPLPWNREKTVGGTRRLRRCSAALAGVALALLDARRASTPVPPLAFSLAGAARSRPSRRHSSKRFPSGSTTTSRCPLPPRRRCGSRALTSATAWEQSRAAFLVLAAARARRQRWSSRGSAIAREP